MHRNMTLRHIAAGALLLTSLVGYVQANERRFTYTYESGVMAPGTRELEYWATWRNGRADFYSRFDHRLEYEFGLTDRLLTAFYFNWRSISKKDPDSPDPDKKKAEQEFSSVSSEWKYKVLDPVANPIGLALYQEYSLGSDEFEWENRLILDKKIGNTLLAYNFVVEPDWEFSPSNVEPEIGVENDFGVTQFLTPRFSAGLEVRNHNEWTRTSTGFEHSALFMGPVLSYAGESWWITATFFRQLPALKKSIKNPQDNLVLDEHEKTNIRLLASIRF